MKEISEKTLEGVWRAVIAHKDKDIYKNIQATYDYLIDLNNSIINHKFKKDSEKTKKTIQILDAYIGNMIYVLIEKCSCKRTRILLDKLYRESWRSYLNDFFNFISLLGSSIDDFSAKCTLQGLFKADLMNLSSFIAGINVYSLHEVYKIYRELCKSKS